MKVETKIHLNKFKPRPYQLKFCESFEQASPEQASPEQINYKKFFLCFPRRCLHGDTHILLSNGSFKLLKEIVVGDEILSWDGNAFVRDTVVNAWKTGVKPTVKVEVVGFPPLIVSKDHLFACFDKKDRKYTVCWKSCDYFRGMRLLLYPKWPQMLYFSIYQEVSRRLYHGCLASCHYSVNSTHNSEQLYDIETKNNHNFVANGYLVHNSGKDFTIFNLVLRAAIRKVGSYFYCLPTFKQARLVIWDSITMSGERFLDCIPKELIKRINQQEMVIELINGSIIRLIGSDTYDTSLVGTNPIMVVFSEYALSDDRAYKFVRPILNANEGTVVICSTPRGYNSFYDLYQIAKNNPKEWYCEKLTIDDTQHISIEQIRKDIAMGEISEELAQQEYWCSFSMGIEGSYYGHYIDNLRLKGQICEVPWEPAYLVHCAFDLGMRDATSIIFFQVIGTVVHIIDYYENDSQGLEHYARYLQGKPYTYGKIFAPHDIKVRELGTGLSRLEKARQLGIPFVLAPNLLISDGIEAVRSTLPKCWIDEKQCARLIKCLENYHREWDNKRKIYQDHPLHDQYSHGADAMRYLCLCLPKIREDSSPEELERRYNEVRYGTSSNLPAPFNDRQLTHRVETHRVFQKPFNGKPYY